MARIIILNGVGSVGKTSIARALQGMTTQPFLHFQMDSFLEMLPKQAHEQPEWFDYIETTRDGAPAVGVIEGPLGAKLMAGMRRAAAALAGQGCHLIIDDVASAGAIQDYRDLLAGHDLRIVALVAPLPVIVARERARGDRMIGLARAQSAWIHQGVNYDLEVDAAQATAKNCARLIRDAFGL